MKRKSPYEQALERLNEYIDSHQMRHTPEREIVLQLVFELPPFFTAKELEEKCKAEHLTRGTVYNSLELFVSAQILRGVHRLQGNHATEYEVIVEEQPHMWVICQKCGRVFDMKDKAVERIIMERKYTNFGVTHFSLVVYGQCKTCRATRAGRYSPKSTPK